MASHTRQADVTPILLSGACIEYLADDLVWRMRGHDDSFIREILSEQMERERRGQRPTDSPNRRQSATATTATAATITTASPTITATTTMTRSQTLLDLLTYLHYTTQMNSTVAEMNKKQIESDEADLEKIERRIQSVIANKRAEGRAFKLNSTMDFKTFLTDLYYNKQQIRMKLTGRKILRDSRRPAMSNLLRTDIDEEGYEREREEERKNQNPSDLIMAPRGRKRMLIMDVLEETEEASGRKNREKRSRDDQKCNIDSLSPKTHREI